MWQQFLHLLAAAKRPLAVLDFETAGLGGAPPVEFAVAYWAPWCDPAMDATSRRARALCPPGLTYAASYRLDPLVPIDPEATAIHGIRDEDVRGKAPPFNEIGGVSSLFRGLAEGSPADGEGPAVFVGHNAAEADVPWARRWGYLPGGIDPRLDVVDTMRMQRRLTREHAHPLAVDALGLSGNEWMRDVRTADNGMASFFCPAIGHGLKPYASNLEGLHTALFGDPHDGGHGALADLCATARCLAAMLELWSPLWSCACPGRDQADDLARLLAALDAPPPGQLGWDGWLAPRPMGVPVERLPPVLWGRKARKHVGKPITVDPSYARWVCGLPSEPTGVDGEAWCSPRTREIIEGANK
jgi:DNA polymerase III epsilon subunit-like protein